MRASPVADFNKRKAALCEKYAADLRLLVESSHQKAASLQTEYECLPAGSSVAGVWDALKTSSEAEADVMDDMAVQLKESAVGHTELFTSHRKTVKLVMQVRLRLFAVVVFRSPPVHPLMLTYPFFKKNSVK